MTLNLEQKQAVVAEVAAVAGRAHSAIAAQYAGLSVRDMTALRRAARGAGVYLRVVRNTLARRAVQGTQFECMSDALVGPLVLAFSEQDPGAAARVIGDFAKGHDKLVVKAVAMGGTLMDAKAIETLAKLPTREQALSMLLALMKAPVTQLVRTLAEPTARLARTFAAIRDQKQAA